MDAKPHIMIVEEQSIAHLVVRFLDQYPCRISITHDGISALKQLEEDPAALVITELNLPEMDGLGVIRSLRKSAPDTKIIALCAYYPDTPGYLETALKFGAERVLRKPLLRAEFIDAVETVLGAASNGRP